MSSARSLLALVVIAVCVQSPEQIHRQFVEEALAREEAKKKVDNP